MDKPVNKVNIERWNGFADKYHNCRPIPPDIITKIILTWLKRTPEVVVDIGSGTGLSTVIWKDLANTIIGIEPNDDMRASAEKHKSSEHITYKKGFSNETGLPTNYSDIVTVCTAFHWMDIDSTLTEINRILRDGGILAVFVSGYPSIIDWMVEKSYRELSDKSNEISYSQEKSATHNIRNGISYLDELNACGKFKYVKELACHSVEKCTHQRLMDLTLTQGSINDALKIDRTLEKEVEDFSNLIRTRCGNEFDVIFSYRMWLAVK